MGVLPCKLRSRSVAVHSRMGKMSERACVALQYLCIAAATLWLRSCKRPTQCRRLRTLNMLARCVGNRRRRRPRSEIGPCLLASRYVCSNSATIITEKVLHMAGAASFGMALPRRVRVVCGSSCVFVQHALQFTADVVFEAVEDTDAAVLPTLLGGGNGGKQHEGTAAWQQGWESCSPATWAMLGEEGKAWAGESGAHKAQARGGRELVLLNDRSKLRS